MTSNITRRDALSILGGAVTGLPLIGRLETMQTSSSQGAVPPNVIFIMTDDQRQDAMSAYGNPVLKTPHMDSIAAGGVRFTEAFVTNALCGPSRASVLTGVRFPKFCPQDSQNSVEKVGHPGT